MLFRRSGLRGKDSQPRWPGRQQPTKEKASSVLTTAKPLRRQDAVSAVRAGPDRLVKATLKVQISTRWGGAISGNSRGPRPVETGLKALTLESLESRKNGKKKKPKKTKEPRSVLPDVTTENAKMRCHWWRHKAQGEKRRRRIRRVARPGPSQPRNGASLAVRGNLASPVPPTGRPPLPLPSATGFCFLWQQRMAFRAWAPGAAPGRLPRICDLPRVPPSRYRVPRVAGTLAAIRPCERRTLGGAEPGAGSSRSGCRSPADGPPGPLATSTFVFVIRGDRGR